MEQEAVVLHNGGHGTILGQIGDTPFVRLPRFAPSGGANHGFDVVYAAAAAPLVERAAEGKEAG
jgi:hypothetical protein